MTDIDVYTVFDDIQSHMADEESLTILAARIDYAVDNNVEKYADAILKLSYRWSVSDLNPYLAIDGVKYILIFGAGKFGQYTARLLDQSGCQKFESYFIDNDKHLWGNTVAGRLVLSLDQAERDTELLADSIVIIANRYCAKEMREQALSFGISEKRIFCPIWSSMWLRGYRVGKYFDYFDLSKGEVYVDIGTDDGKDAQVFEKTGKKSEKYLLREGSQYLSRKMEVEAALSNCHYIQKLDQPFGDFLRKTGAGYLKICETKKTIEYLISASKILKQNRIKLMIDVNGHPMEMFRIAGYLLQTDRDYRFALREYQLPMGGLVLYAF